jgi:S-DNA-T family DNA segregation ATPase FtsK/SpoIIIE
MLAAGWHAHTLNAPGKFLIAAAEHDTPKRARAYLLTDQVVEAAATYYADYRPPLDPISQQAAGEDQPERMVVPPDTHTMTPEGVQDGPDVLLWAALVTAPPNGATVPDLMTATGMSRPWIYLRLRDLADAGHVIQVSRGRWRAVTDDTE